MKYSMILFSVLFTLSACKLDTKSSAELLFPLGHHTWTKGEDFRNSPPSNTCSGCPQFDLSSPILSQLQSNGWKLSLAPGETFTKIIGTTSGFSENSCGENNDLLCDNAWRVWPPNSGDQAINQSTPGGQLFGPSFWLEPSFECGTSRFVLAAQNTYGTTRLIFEVERTGGVCAANVVGANLRIILNWNKLDTDLDLHLIREPSEFGNLSNDCHFRNCKPSDNPHRTSTLDWGIQGNTADNPVLDVDDAAHGGPENIFLYGAQNADFLVNVHYHDDSPQIGAVLPYLEVWVDGVLKKQILYTHEFESFTPRKIWEPCTINIENGVVNVVELQTVQHR